MSSEDTLEDKLRAKLASGEITQDEFDSLHSKFQKLGILGDTSTKDYAKTDYTRSGMNKIKPGKVDGPVNIFGSALVDGDLECRQLSISGSAELNGDLTVTGKSSITGNVTIQGISRFGDKLAVSGSLQTFDNLYAVKTTSIAGKLEIKGDFITEGKSLITGKLIADNLKSTNEIKISAKVDIAHNVICDKIEIQSGKNYIGGNLKGKNIQVFPQTRRSESHNAQSEADDSITGLISTVINNVIPPVINSIFGGLDTRPMALQVDGNIEGDTIYLANTNITGNIIGQHISIGPNVQVKGAIKYSKSIEVTNGSEYEIQKV